MADRPREKVNLHILRSRSSTFFGSGPHVYLDRFFGYGQKQASYEALHMCQSFFRPDLSTRAAPEVRDVRRNARPNCSQPFSGVFIWQPSVGTFQRETALLFDFKRQRFSGGSGAPLNVLAEIPKVEMVNALFALLEH